MKQRNYFERKLIEASLGISIDGELQSVMRSLENLPQTPEIEGELQRLESL